MWKPIKDEIKNSKNRVDRFQKLYRHEAMNNT